KRPRSRVNSGADRPAWRRFPVRATEGGAMVHRADPVPSRHHAPQASTDHAALTVVGLAILTAVVGAVTWFFIPPWFVHSLGPDANLNNEARAALAVASIFVVALFAALVNSIATLFNKPPLPVAIPPGWDAALQLIVALVLGILISLSVFQ